jgi:hypothetical protein
MGCNCSKDLDYHKLRKNAADGYFYNLKITVLSSSKTISGTFEIDRESIILYELVNMICFNTRFEDTLQANFINRYNEKKDDFDYYIERLYGETIENYNNPNKGKIWIPYINNVQEDWSEICRKNRVVSNADNIEFIYDNM